MHTTTDTTASRTCVAIAIMLTISAASSVPAAFGQDEVATNDVALIAQRLDSLIDDRLALWHVPGAAVAVVSDGRIWTKGYGLADIDSRRPVDAGRTAFRVASVSKLLTATAAMQLVEQGRIDLHEDIQPYLGETALSTAYDEAVTLHRLLTHTAGFDLSDIGDATTDANKVYSLEELISEHAIPQVLRPGTAYHYSNFGYAVIGHLVERVTGEAFEAYADLRLFEPLGMSRSTFAQPPPEAIRSALATGYYWNGSEFAGLPLDYSHVGPADALITTADDMARFIVAHLDSAGELLDAAMLDTMHAQQYAGSPSPYGMAYGFQENYLHGRRMLEHGGAGLGFSSYLALFPEDNLGVFVAQNRREGNLRWDVIRVVADLLLDPVDEPLVPLEPDKRYPVDPSAYTGRYRHTGYPHYTFEKAAFVLGFRGSRAHVEAADSGALLIDGQRFVASGPHMFTHPEQPHWVKGFVMDQSGRAEYHVAGREVLVRLLWWEHKRVIQLTLMASIVLCVWCFGAWPLARRKARRRQVITEPTGAKNARRTLIALSALWCASLITFFAAMPFMMGGPIQFDYGPTPALIGVLTVLTAAAAGTIVFACVVTAAWIRRWWSVSARVAATATSLTLLGGGLALHYMNLVGFQV